MTVVDHSYNVVDAIVTSIQGYAQLLLGRGLATPQQSEAAKVFQEAERAR